MFSYKGERNGVASIDTEVKGKVSSIPYLSFLSSDMRLLIRIAQRKKLKVVNC